MAEWLCVPSGKRLNVGSSPTVGAVFSAMKAEYVVVAEQAHPLGPAYSPPYSLLREVMHVLLLLHAIIPCLHTQIVIHLCGSMNSELRTIHVICWSAIVMPA